MKNIPLKNASEDIVATINALRDRANKDHVKTAEEYRSEIRLLKYEITRLRTNLANREKVYDREKDRLVSFLRMLANIRGRDLKKAVSLIVYWDKFSWLDAAIVERLRQEDKRIKAFFDLPRNYGNINAMNKFLDSQELVNALRQFGYSKIEAEFRVSTGNNKGDE